MLYPKYVGSTLTVVWEYSYYKRDVVSIVKRIQQSCEHFFFVGIYNFTSVSVKSLVMV